MSIKMLDPEQLAKKVNFRGLVEKVKSELAEMLEGRSEDEKELEALFGIFNMTLAEVWDRLKEHLRNLNPLSIRLLHQAAATVVDSLFEVALIELTNRDDVLCRNFNATKLAIFTVTALAVKEMTEKTREIVKVLKEGGGAIVF